MNDMTNIVKRGRGRPKGSKDTKPRLPRGSVKYREKEETLSWVVIDPERYRTCASEGMTLSEAARFIGVSREAVRLAAIRLNLAFTRGKNLIDHDRLVEMVVEGKNAHEIATEVNCSVATVRNIAKVAGVKIPRKPKPEPARIEIIRSLAAIGLTATDIARRTGRFVSVVLRDKKNFNITFLAKFRSLK